MRQPAVTALADRIDALLPQTQCTKCGYAGCRPYAEAMAARTAPINQCPPGGAAGIVELAALLRRPVLPLNPANGVERPLTVAVIDEALCIGCTLCIQACPVDCIIGAPTKMHSVIESQCTGCDLCLPPCPMDCIAMVPVQPPRAWTRADADGARRRYGERNARRATEKASNERRLAEKAVARLAELDARDDLTAAQVARRKSVVEAALARARARRAAASTSSSAPPTE
ncbi:MAG TPA: electron transport complex subunit RsxB [Burkholderiaceae bacterium]|nr:electron transport complex subunit RsxB [Burkholderiaceae bacterium]